MNGFYYNTNNHFLKQALPGSDVSWNDSGDKEKNNCFSTLFSFVCKRKRSVCIPIFFLLSEPIKDIGFLILQSKNQSLNIM